MLTDDQIIYLLTRDGSREDMLRAAYRMGMERAAIICDRIDREDDTGYAVVGECVNAIRAMATAATTERKPGGLSALDQRLEEFQQGSPPA